MLYQSGRSNLALTVFVPYDCKNNCPFCTSKEMYKNPCADMTEIINQIKVLGNLNLVRDIVFTGGEPFADLAKLEELLYAAKSTGKNVFINTTMPNADFINYHKDLIDGISVSRHIKVKTQEVLDKELYRISPLIPVRINSVLYNITEKDAPAIKDFILRYSDFQINFREDYRKTNVANLKNVIDNDFINLLVNECGLTYYYGGGCQVCNDDVFSYNVHYHRGLEYNSFTIGNTTVVNDLIIYPTGEVCYDWDLNKRVNDELIRDLDYKGE